MSSKKKNICLKIACKYLSQSCGVQINVSRNRYGSRFRFRLIYARSATLDPNWDVAKRRTSLARGLIPHGYAQISWL